MAGIIAVSLSLFRCWLYLKMLSVFRFVSFCKGSIFGRKIDTVLADGLVVSVLISGKRESEAQLGTAQA